MKTPTKQTAHRLAAVLAIATAFAATGVWAATTTYYQIAGTSDETCIFAQDCLSADEEITHTPKLAFPGITLDDIPVGASFFSAMYGESMGGKTIDQAVPATGFCEQRCDSNNDGKTDKIAIQCDAYDKIDSKDSWKAVIIVLTNGENGEGVYVKKYAQCYKKSNTEYAKQCFTLATDGTIASANSPSDWSTTKTTYQLAGLRVHGMSPVNTAPRLAFRGATLEDVKDCLFMADFQFGTWMTSATVSNTASFVSTWYDGNDALKKVVMQFRAPSDATAVIELTDGMDGVYAQQVLGVSGVSANTRAFAINPDTGAITKAAGTDQGADKYGIHDFVIKYPPCVKKTPNKIKVWSSGNSENPLTLDDIKEGTFTARFSGATGKDRGFLDVPNSATGYFKKFRTDDIVVEFQVQNGDYDCCVVVSFTNGADGIYAEVIDAKNKKDETAGNYEFYKADGTFNSCNNSTVAETWTANYYGVCDLRVTVPTVHKWTLNANTTWSELRGGETVEADEVVKITVEDTAAVLTVDEDVEVGKIEFIGETCAQMIVASGNTLTAESISGVAKISNDGTLVKTGSGTEAWPFDNASTGTTTVSAGTLKVASQIGSGMAHTVRVKNGATFDLNGVNAVNVKIILEDGANYANTKNFSNAWNANLPVQLVLEGDATATASNNYLGIRKISGSSHLQTSVNLGNHTLSVNGSSGKEFILENVTIDGTGKIVVNGGILHTYSTVSGADCTVEIGQSGKIQFNGSGLTVRNFTNNGSDNGSDATLTVTGTLTTGSGAIKNLTLADGATIKASATQAQTVSTTFSVSGTGDKTITVDASAIDAETLKAAIETGIPVLTVPAAFDPSGVKWDVTGAAVANTRAKWSGNTLRLYPPTGLMVIFR